MKPNRVHIRAWVKALRSKKYKQAQGGLRRQIEDGGFGYCCLGVACEVFRLKTGKGDWGNTVFSSAGQREPNFLPKAVQRWLGIDSKDPVLKEQKDEDLAASELNDGEIEVRKPYGFPRIASLIEKRYLCPPKKKTSKK